MRSAACFLRSPQPGCFEQGRQISFVYQVNAIPTSLQSPIVGIGHGKLIERENYGKAGRRFPGCLRECPVIALANARTLIILVMALHSSPQAQQTSVYREDQVRHTLDAPVHYRLDRSRP